MDDKIATVQQLKGKPNTDIVEILEELLAQAKEGSFTGIHVVTRAPSLVSLYKEGEWRNVEIVHALSAAIHQAVGKLLEAEQNWTDGKPEA